MKKLIDKNFNKDYPKDGPEFVGSLYDIYAAGFKAAYSELRKELEEKEKALNYCHKRMAGAYDEINRLNKLLNPTT